MKVQIILLIIILSLSVGVMVYQGLLIHKQKIVIQILLDAGQPKYDGPRSWSGPGLNITNSGSGPGHRMVPLSTSGPGMSIPSGSADYPNGDSTK